MNATANKAKWDGAFNADDTADFRLPVPEGHEAVALHEMIGNPFGVMVGPNARELADRLEGGANLVETYQGVADWHVGEDGAPITRWRIDDEHVVYFADHGTTHRQRETILRKMTD